MPSDVDEVVVGDGVLSQRTMPSMSSGVRPASAMAASAASWPASARCGRSPAEIGLADADDRAPVAVMQLLAHEAAGLDGLCRELVAHDPFQDLARCRSRAASCGCR